MTLTQSVVLLVIGSLLAAGLAFLASWFWWGRNQAITKARDIAVGHEKLMDRVRELEVLLAQVNTSILPINAAFQAILIKELTHFHTPRMDELMRKLGPPYSLTEEEERELAAALLERERDLNGGIPESERDAAHILPIVMKRVKAEAQTVAHAPTQLQIVTVVPDEEKPK